MKNTENLRITLDVKSTENLRLTLDLNTTENLRLTLDVKNTVNLRLISYVKNTSLRLEVSTIARLSIFLLKDIKLRLEGVQYKISQRHLGKGFTGTVEDGKHFFIVNMDESPITQLRTCVEIIVFIQ